MTDKFAPGVLRTASDRTTYAPDGLIEPSNAGKARPTSGLTGHTIAVPPIPTDEQQPSSSAARSRHSSASTLHTHESEDREKKAAIEDPAHLHPDDTIKFNRRQSDADDYHWKSERDIEKAEEPRDSDVPKGEEETDPNLVDWNGPDDPENPMNWPNWKKWLITVMLGLMTFVITFASSVFSTTVQVTAKIFNVSSEVMILGTSLFVLGFAFGPIVWGPLSELYGRKYPLFFGFFVFAIFQIPVAVAQNLQTVMLCRFFGGFFGSAPLAIVGGTLADFWDPVTRGIAVTIFAGATFIGPVAGPIAGGFITQSYLGWRWTEYLTAIMGFGFGGIGFFIVQESFAPVLLQRRASKMRFETRNWALHAKADESPVDFKVLLEKYCLRPFQMLVMEPILLLITVYMALIYGILYLFFEAYPIAFQEVRGWSLGVGALPFLSITVGVLIGGGIIVYTTKTRFAKKLEKEGHVVPEERLIPMIIGGAVFPMGLFWFAWTSNPNITWVPQVLSGIFIGAGVLMIFLQGLNYIIDVYMWHANSAIAGNTFARSLVGAGFPMFATAMFHNLGVPWATSVLGFLTAALFPVPILFYIYGAKIRKMSKFSPTE